MIQPTVLYDEISSCTSSLQFSAFLLPGKFLQTFSNASQPFLIVAFSFVLRSRNLNSCLIWGPTKIHSFILASLILGNFCLNRQTLHFLYSLPAKVLEHELQQILKTQKFTYISDFTAKM